jgi:hypothetical protein
VNTLSAIKADAIRLWQILAGLVAVQAMGYAAIAWLSQSFDYDDPVEGRPLLAVLALFGVCFACTIASVAVAVRLGDSGWLTGTILTVAVVFRGLLLFTPPIQEVDIYRYIWDGEVGALGMNPYGYPPGVILAALEDVPRPPAHAAPDLVRLVHVLERSPGLEDVIRRVHFPELTTIYPPVSQAVFACAAMLMPTDASAFTRVTIMKGVLFVFDMATLGLMICLLRVARKPVGLAILYGWCPLVIKEIANSGHLDSIAVCLTTASLCLAARAWFRQGAEESRASRLLAMLLSSAVLLGLAVGAKIYPLVLLPLVTVMTAARGGIRRAALTCAATLLTAACCLAPMVWPLSGDDASAATDPSGTTMGLAAFVSRWEINDLVFMVVFENLRPADPKAPSPPAWFAIVPTGCRQAVIGPLASFLGVTTDRAAFWTARALTGVLFLLILIGLLIRVARTPTLPNVLEAAFLTLAWFWLLAPTQNPWYWTWALPLLPFARGWAWRAVSGLVFLSYLRFWLVSRYPEAGVCGTPYNGSQFFDFVIPWIEFGPWFLWLAVSAGLRGRADPSPGDADTGVCGEVHRTATKMPLGSPLPDTSSHCTNGGT